jgi:hypothetical protein
LLHYFKRTPLHSDDLYLDPDLDLPSTPAAKPLHLDIMASASVRPEPNPFHLLHLPRELRDVVYRFALVQDHPLVPIVHRDRNRPSITLAIFRASRQLYQETVSVFYHRNVFKFRTARDAMWFFNYKPDHVKDIHHLALELGVIIQQLGVHLYHFMVKREQLEHENFETLCSLLSTHGELRSMSLNVRGGWTYRPEPQHMTPQVPGWVAPLLGIRNLHRLSLYWDCGEDYPEGKLVEMRTVARLLCAKMLQNGSTMSGAKGIRILKPHLTADYLKPQMTADSLKYGKFRIRRRRTELEMSIDKDGYFERKRRVKVLPSSWCEACGRFEAPPSNCSCGGDLHPCDGILFGYDHHVPLCDCGQGPSMMYYADKNKLDTMLRLPSAENGSRPAEEHAWDNKRWGAKSLQEYLPQGTTEDEFLEAKTLLEAGYILQLHRNCQRCDYSDSDFGHNDSLLSVHGWSDDEDAEDNK